ncbi:MAG TPA: hypothetical protein VGK96_18160 [Candidatus Sulfotelmatobacter sp.]|jgi:hypothetical protein
MNPTPRPILGDIKLDANYLTPIVVTNSFIEIAQFWIKWRQIRPLSVAQNLDRFESSSGAIASRGRRQLGIIKAQLNEYQLPDKKKGLQTSNSYETESDESDRIVQTTVERRRETLPEGFWILALVIFGGSFCLSGIAWLSVMVFGRYIWPSLKFVMGNLWQYHLRFAPKRD